MQNRDKVCQEKVCWLKEPTSSKASDQADSKLEINEQVTFFIC